MAEAGEEVDIQLEMKDRINFPHILQTTILNIKRALMNVDVDMDMIESMMWDLFTDIPHAWYDVQFSIDVKKAFTTKKVDNRPEWAGVPMNLEICKKYNISPTKIIPVINIYILKNAIFNLLHRRDMLVRKKKIEYSTGKNLVDTLKDLEKLSDENDEMIESHEDRIEAELKELEDEKNEL